MPRGQYRPFGEGSVAIWETPGTKQRLRLPNKPGVRDGAGVWNVPQRVRRGRRWDRKGLLAEPVGRSLLECGVATPLSFFWPRLGRKRQRLFGVRRCNAALQ